VTTMQRTLCTKTTTATPTGINNLHLSQVELNLSLAGNLLWNLGCWWWNNNLPTQFGFSAIWSYHMSSS
jgi:hypothetical protein